jgi:hypothetical protein
VAAAVGMLVVLVAGFTAYNWVHNQMVAVSVTYPVPGRQCAVATGSNGVAIDCWKVTL